MSKKVKLFMANKLDSLAKEFDDLIDFRVKKIDYIKTCFFYISIFIFIALIIASIYIASDSILFTLLLSILLTPILLFYFQSRYSYSLTSRAVRIGVSKKLFASLYEIYKDDLLLREMVKIIRLHGDIKDIVYNATVSINNGCEFHYSNSYSISRCRECDLLDYFSKTRDKVILNIAEEIVASSGFKNFSKKHNFDQKDIDNMTNMFYYIISRPDFPKTTELFLFPYTDQNIKFIRSAISSSEFEPFSDGKFNY